MKTVQEWLEEWDKPSGHSLTRNKFIDFFRRIQSDAIASNPSLLIKPDDLLKIPKWVTGTEAREWPEESWVICQMTDDNENVFNTFGHRKNFHHLVELSTCRFLHLDDILAQPWPEEKGNA